MDVAMPPTHHATPVGPSTVAAPSDYKPGAPAHRPTHRRRGRGPTTHPDGSARQRRPLRTGTPAHAHTGPSPSPPEPATPHAAAADPCTSHGRPHPAPVHRTMASRTSGATQSARTRPHTTRTTAAPTPPTAAAQASDDDTPSRTTPGCRASGGTAPRSADSADIRGGQPRATWGEKYSERR
jgi:hypothetical protein